MTFSGDYKSNWLQSNDLQSFFIKYEITKKMITIFSPTKYSGNLVWIFIFHTSLSHLLVYTYTIFVFNTSSYFRCVSMFFFPLNIFIRILDGVNFRYIVRPRRIGSKLLVLWINFMTFNAARLYEVHTVKYEPSSRHF